MYEDVQLHQMAALVALERTVERMQRKLPPADRQRQPTDISGIADTRSTLDLIWARF